MKYYIKQSFYLDGIYSGEAGTEIDKEHYLMFTKRGLQEHLEVSGLIPSFLKSDEELEKEINQLLEEKKLREEAKKNQLKKDK